MIYIQKTNSPQGLTQYLKDIPKEQQSYEENATAFSKREDYSKAFDELRSFLVQEQGGICCYCQQKIEFSYDIDEISKHINKIIKMKTEHFLPKSDEKYKHLQLDYTNLLASCLGNSEYGNKTEKHCDSKKSIQVLKFIQNPSQGKRRDFKRIFRYDVRPRQEEVVVLPFEENEELKYDIDKVLNLNEQTLKNKRYSVFKKILAKVEKKGGELDLQKMQDILADYYLTELKGNRQHHIFCDFIAYWLEIKIKRYSK